MMQSCVCCCLARWCVCHTRRHEEAQEYAVGSTALCKNEFGTLQERVRYGTVQEKVRYDTVRYEIE